MRFFIIYQAVAGWKIRHTYFPKISRRTLVTTFVDLATAIQITKTVRGGCVKVSFALSMLGLKMSDAVSFESYVSYIKMFYGSRFDDVPPPVENELRAASGRGCELPDTILMAAQVLSE